eukprot:2047741-Pleurochrysis_carterae.AAC.2
MYNIKYSRLAFKSGTRAKAVCKVCWTCLSRCKVTGKGLKASFNISTSLLNSCRGAVTLQISPGDAA